MIIRIVQFQSIIRPFSSGTMVLKLPGRIFPKSSNHFVYKPFVVDRSLKLQENRYRLYYTQLFSDNTPQIDCPIGGTVHPDNGTASCTKSNKPSSVCHYSCVNGYYVKDGPDKISCTNSGKWTPPSYPRCSSTYPQWSK